MEAYPKFIIEDDVLIIGKCTYHKQLAGDPKDVKGGGWYRFKDNTFTFYGDSFDFGAARMEDIQQAVLEDKVYTSSGRTKNLSTDKFKFVYDTQCELIPLN
jgi:hypothetical protein